MDKRELKEMEHNIKQICDHTKKTDYHEETLRYFKEIRDQIAFLKKLKNC